MRKEKFVAVILLIIAMVAMFFTIWDFEWKCQALTTCFMIVYCGIGTTGLIMLMEENIGDSIGEKQCTTDIFTVKNIRN